mmetsp:Transcript_14755/g.31753  ORF Transcript_14755/g.31753 Transcript_14755/m.31753 type:complete len:478 (+) Transcript_14755:2061-3494(+)
MPVHRQISQVSDKAFLRSHLALITLLVACEVPCALANLLQVGVLVNERRGHNARLKLRMRHDIEQKWNIGLDSTNATLDQHALHPRNRLRKRRPSRRILDNHGVKVGGDGKSRVTHSVHTDAGPGRVAVEGDDTCVRGEVAFGIFGGDTALDRNAAGFDVFLYKTDFIEGSAASDTDLGLDNVNPRDFFSHGVFHLNPRIDLDKIRAILSIHQKLNSSCVLVLRCTRQLHRVFVQVSPQLVRQTPSRRHFNHLLMPPLNRTITFPQVNHVPFSVSNNLDFNVSGTFHIPLHKYIPISKRRQRLAGGRFEEGHEILAVAHNAHPLPASSHGRLEDHGETNLVHESFHRGGVRDGITTGHHWHARRDGGIPRRCLVRECVQVLHGGTHEGDVRIGTGLGELGTLAQEPVSGMNGIRSTFLGNLNNLGNVQVCRNGGGALLFFEDVGFVGTPAMLTVAILVDVDGDTGHVEFGRGTLDTD